MATAADHHFFAVKVPGKGDLLHLEGPFCPSLTLVAAVEQEGTIVDAQRLSLFCRRLFCFFQFFRGQLEKFMAGIGIPAGRAHNGIGIGIIHGAADHTGPAGQPKQGPNLTPRFPGFLSGADHRHFLGVVDHGVLPIVAEGGHRAAFCHHNAGDPVVGTAAGGK